MIQIIEFIKCKSTVSVNIKANNTMFCINTIHKKTIR